jgi:hypothetical protein
MVAKRPKLNDADVVDVLVGTDLPDEYGPPQDPVDEGMAADQLRIAELEAELAQEVVPLPQPPTTPQSSAVAAQREPVTLPRAEAPAPVVERPVPEAQLSPEQRRIRDLEHQLALERGRKDTEPELAALARPGDAGNILIHFVDDGFTALGHVWRRGQELEFEVGSRAYQDTFDRTGWSWLALRDDENAQISRYGRPMFRSGPWQGQSYLDVANMAFDPLKPLSKDGLPPQPPSVAELEKAADAESRRRRAAPVLPMR